jgi:phosphatidate cytidylyltransferase
MKRILTALVVLPFLIASILISSLWWVFVLLATAAMFLGLYDFYLLAKRLQLKPDANTGYVAGAAILTICVVVSKDPAINILLLHLAVIFFTAAMLVAAMLRGAPFDKMLASAGATMLGVLYIPLLGSHLISARLGFEQKLSAHLLSFFFLVLMGADAGAFYIGRAFGKRKLAPTISPGKTWEGVIGAVAAALAMGALSHFWFFRELPLKFTLPLAVVMTVVGMLGDLAESALKRGAGAKDAANILPGHGGFLDRLDSLLFNAPLIYYFALFYFRVDR